MVEHLTQLDSERVGLLSTVTPEGRPHVVPIVFAVLDDTIVTAVDWKQKTGKRLQRLTNIARNPAVSFLVHGYSEDWTLLWWTRVDGTAAIHETGSLKDRATESLVAKYQQYQERPPEGAVIVITPERTSSWGNTG